VTSSYELLLEQLKTVWLATVPVLLLIAACTRNPARMLLVALVMLAPAGVLLCSPKMPVLIAGKVIGLLDGTGALSVWLGILLGALLGAGAGTIVFGARLRRGDHQLDATQDLRVVMFIPDPPELARARHDLARARREPLPLTMSERFDQIKAERPEALLTFGDQKINAKTGKWEPVYEATQPSANAAVLDPERTWKAGHRPSIRWLVEMIHEAA
jgi:hypothetical protein